MPPGANKEAYEPFLWDLLCHPSLPPVTAIWAADIASAGQSFLLNKDDIGDEPHWFDSAQDIKQLINYFQDEMKPPLVGLGQSWGCVAILMCAAWHSRIFQGIICMEPIVETGWYHRNDPERLKNGNSPFVGLRIAPALAGRKDRWSSRDDARTLFLKSREYRKYDPRVFEKMMLYDLQSLQDGTVGLVTPKRQDVAMFVRPSPPLEGFPESEEYATRTEESNSRPGFYNAMGAHVKAAMPGIHCLVHYLWATDDTFISDRPYRKRVTDVTGTGLGGGGGKAKGQVTEAHVNGGHSLPLYNPRETAEAAATWLGGTFKVWWDEEERRRGLEAPIDPFDFPPGFMQRMNDSKL